MVLDTLSLIKSKSTGLCFLTHEVLPLQVYIVFFIKVLAFCGLSVQLSGELSARHTVKPSVAVCNDSELLLFPNTY